MKEMGSIFQLKGKVMCKGMVPAVLFGGSKQDTKRSIRNEIGNVARSQIRRGFV